MTDFRKPTQCADCPYMLPSGIERCPLCPEDRQWRIERDAEEAARAWGFEPAPASGIEAPSGDETRSGSAEGESPTPEGGDAQ